MNIEIINIGDELLIGQVVNTNASWMAEQLNLEGFKVHQFTIIGDTREHILDAMWKAGERSEVVLISGGIGPTKDDITKTTLCDFFGTRLVFNEEAYKDIESIFARRGYEVTELNRQQAYLPEDCTGIPNKLGTARGMWFEKDIPVPGRTGKAIYISMPGVPFEMQAMMKEHIIPELKKRFHPKSIYHKTILTQGIGESFLAAIIEKWENNLPPSIKLAYLPQPGIVRLRLTGTGDGEAVVRGLVDEQAEKLSAIIPDYIFGADDDRLEAIVGQLLKEKNCTLGTAESCTGGYIAHLITSIPGSSAYYKGSIIAYDNAVKEQMLGIMPETFLEFGAVSSEVVTEMAIGAQTNLNVDYVIAVSGVAGPGGGTADKPVGTTWIAIATPDEVFSKEYLFGDSRDRNIRRAALQALNLLRKNLLGQE
ncbi:MAG: competence/damage-inducible protein A [Bacteroidetes bacterium]|nr:competence/damage-inducible protein A [Bacteroidota bacterium]